MVPARGTFGAMTDPDSLTAELLSSGEAAAEDEAGAGGIGDAAVVPFGQGIAVDHGGDADRSAGPAPDGLRPSAVAGQSVDAPDLSSDPMTMYLRDLSATPLLTREGEAALAKRIEVGRRSMLEGLCSRVSGYAWFSAMEKSRVAPLASRTRASLTVSVAPSGGVALQGPRLSCP